MHTYRVTVKTEGMKEVQASNPQEACKIAFPDTELTPMKPGFIFNVVIELLDGKRRSKNLYVGTKKAITPITAEEINKLLVHNALIGVKDEVDSIIKYLLNRGVKDIKTIDIDNYSFSSKKEKATYLLVKIGEQDYFLIIPNYVKGLGGFRSFDWIRFKSTRIDTITVLGGQSLEDISDMFSKFVANTVDLSYMIPSNLHYADRVFFDSSIKNIIGLEHLNFENTDSISMMFARCKTSKVYLRNIEFNNLTTMDGMFKNCDIELVDLSGTKDRLPHVYADDCFVGAYIGKLIVPKSDEVMCDMKNQLRKNKNFNI